LVPPDAPLVPPLVVVLSGPSGAGKDAVMLRMRERALPITVPATMTTRAPRDGEVTGVHHVFVSRPEFERALAGGELLEHAEVYGYGYGTPRHAVEEALAAGRDVLFDIDWQGTQQLREVAREDMVSVFILPPSMEELEQRLRRRAQDSEAVVRRRLAQVAADVTHFAEYDYVLINSDLEESVGRARAILAAERLRRHRQPGLTEFIGQFRAPL
jgi:guanylate kinase